MNPIEVFIYICFVYCLCSAIYYIVFFFYRTYKFHQCREKTICKEENCRIRKHCKKARFSDREEARLQALIDSLPDTIEVQEEKDLREVWSEISRTLLKKKKH